MRILIVSRGYPTDRYPLNGIFEMDQAKALYEAGHEVILAVIDLRSIRHRRKYGFQSKMIEGIKVEEISIPLGRIPRALRLRIGKGAFKVLLKKIINRYGYPDIVHSHFLEISYMASKSVVDKSLPFVVTEHLSFMNQENVIPIYTKIAKITYSRAKRVTAPSRNFAAMLQRLYNCKVFAIPNIVDIKNFRYEKNFASNTDTFQFVCVANLIKRKKVDLLLKAFMEVFGKEQKVQLIVFGNGPEKKYLERMIFENGRENQIFLMGRQTRDVIAKSYEKANCFVLVSEVEPFGVVYIEAMAAGLPVIASDCDGPADIVDDSNGLLVKKNSLEELQNALKYMYQNIGKFSRQDIAKETVRRYAPETVAFQLEELYKEVIRERKAI